MNWTIKDWAVWMPTTSLRAAVREQESKVLMAAEPERSTEQGKLDVLCAELGRREEC